MASLVFLSSEGIMHKFLGLAQRSDLSRHPLMGWHQIGLTMALSLGFSLPSFAHQSLDHQSILQPVRPEVDIAKQQLRIGDRFWTEGDKPKARQYYQLAKPAFTDQVLEEILEPTSDAATLSPAGRVYWRNAQAGLEQNLRSKALISLELLVEESPHFVPGRIAQVKQLLALEEAKEEEEERDYDVATEALGNALSRYGSSTELIAYAIEFYDQTEQWLYASLLARQFSLLYPDHPQQAEYVVLADDYWEDYQSDLRAEIRGNTFANFITGAVGFALTGSLIGPLTALESSVLLLQGEEAVGSRISENIQENAPMLEDEEVLAYVREIGDRLTAFVGQDRFNYEFYVVMSEDLNAFALPGGKIFVNAGAILDSRSEAELAGLLSHEIAHAALSHGFQLVTEGNLTANITSHIPLGRFAGNLITLNYSRNMERQADAFGTRVLASSPYAADGLYNLTVTLNEQVGDEGPPTWLSTHPGLEERVANIQAQIISQNYDRYTFEGINRHEEIQEIVRGLVAEEKRKEAMEENLDEEDQDNPDD